VHLLAFTLRRDAVFWIQDPDTAYNMCETEALTGVSFLQRCRASRLGRIHDPFEFPINLGDFRGVGIEATFRLLRSQGTQLSLRFDPVFELAADRTTAVEPDGIGKGCNLLTGRRP
jgi:hypothetical protein